jgi:hypothetical protein
VFGVFGFPAAAVAQVGVGQLVGNDVTDERLGAKAQGALQHDRSARAASTGDAQGNLCHARARGRVVVADREGRVGDEIQPNCIRQRRDHLVHVIVQRCVERETAQPGFQTVG